jgi:hypothetical protein
MNSRRRDGSRRAKNTAVRRLYFVLGRVCCWAMGGDERAGAPCCTRASRLEQKAESPAPSIIQLAHVTAFASALPERRSRQSPQVGAQERLVLARSPGQRPRASDGLWQIGSRRSYAPHSKPTATSSAGSGPTEASAYRILLIPVNEVNEPDVSPISS